MSKTLLTVFLALLFIPAAHAVTDIPVENDFATFTLPKGWKVIESRSKKLPKPLVYFRQKYKVTTLAGPTGSAYVYAQDLPGFRGSEMSLADIDAAFERTSQLSGDTSALVDEYIPSIMDLKTSTGTFLGKPSREIEFWTERDKTIITVRMSHVSFGGKIYAIEFYSTKGVDALHADWTTLHDSMRARSGSASSSSSSTRSGSAKSSKSSSSKPAKVDRSPRGSKSKVEIRRRARLMRAELPASGFTAL